MMGSAYQRFWFAQGFFRKITVIKLKKLRYPPNLLWSFRGIDDEMKIWFDLPLTNYPALFGNVSSDSSGPLEKQAR